MAKLTHIYVTAPAGRVTPVAKEDAVEPDGSTLFVKQGSVKKVRYFRADGSTSQTIRRSVSRGDLIKCDMNGAPVDSYELAAVSDETDPTATRKATSK
jgi:hypothetical protein